jgi:SOS-response transcriptional repressor LexA
MYSSNHQKSSDRMFDDIETEINSKTKTSVKIVKKDGIIFCTIKATEDITSTLNEVALLPADYRPNEKIQVVRSTDATNICEASIDSLGDFNLTITGTYTVSQNEEFSFFWIE